MPTIKKAQWPWDSHKYIKKHDKFYDSRAWRRLSDLHRLEFPFCQYCLPDNIVDGYATDHTLPRNLFPELELERSNLKTICKTCDGRKRYIESLCHDRQTAIQKLTEAGFYGEKK